MTIRKCVSFGNLGQGGYPPGDTAFGRSAVDLYGPVTTDGYSNLSWTQATATPWVRLMVVWPFWWPNPPGAAIDAAHPYAVSDNNLNQAAAQLRDLNTNINLAHAANKRVILTTVFFPAWTNPTAAQASSAETSSSASTGSGAGTLLGGLGAKPKPLIGPAETVIDASNWTMPADNVLMLPTAAPPNGKAFEPADFGYYHWVYTLMNGYHPGNPNRPAAMDGAWIDAFELVNEPNVYISDPSGARDMAQLAHGTALMMNTAKYVKTTLNQAYAHSGKALYLLGPALAPVSGWERFGKQVLAQLLAMNRSKRIVDREFGWSHHNYTDVEQIGQGLHAVDTLLRRHPHTISPARRRRVLRAVAPNLYGAGTQRLRSQVLKRRWRGWRDPGQPDPTVFMSEGGARLEQLPGFFKQGADPNAPVAADAATKEALDAKLLQAYSVGGAAEALSNRRGFGEGVEMFTNYLFFDDVGWNFSGLCDQYAAERLHPSFSLHPGSCQPAPAANGPSTSYERPAYTAWKDFGVNGLP